MAASSTRYSGVVSAAKNYELTQIHPQEITFLSYVRARIHIVKREYDHARDNLEVALKIDPEYDPARGLLDRLELIQQMTAGWSDFIEQSRQRQAAQRERQRLLITSPDPTLAEAFGIYTKDILTAIARHVIPWGGWSSYKKGKLHQYLVDYFQEDGAFERVLNSLAAEERGAFEQVLENGGTMDWNLFDRKFGNDLDESPYWHYHEPNTIMGRLRSHGLLIEVTVDRKLLISIPMELRKRPILSE